MSLIENIREMLKMVIISDDTGRFHTSIGSRQGSEPSKTLFAFKITEKIVELQEH